ERFYLSHFVLVEFLVVSVEDTDHRTEGKYYSLIKGRSISFFCRSNEFPCRLNEESSPLEIWSIDNFVVRTSFLIVGTKCQVPWNLAHMQLSFERDFFSFERYVNFLGFLSKLVVIRSNDFWSRSNEYREK
ncbi:hypothetical protein GIB67_011824, partial [Kingdonia uniflora]